MYNTHAINLLTERIKLLTNEIIRLKAYQEQSYGEYIFVMNDIENMEHEKLSLQKSLEILLKNE
jgi:biopolymer transport protein ExbD